ncbi:hypothetical protein CBS147346_6235 [Aspergillus niger]|nr:hypothetical protein CBS147346_6235 [Aspergillus niger]
MPDAPSSASGKKSTEEPPPIQWQFIDASDNSRSTLTKVKRHVMQEYMRQKRHATGQSAAEIGDSPSHGEKTEQQQRTINQVMNTTDNQTDRTQDSEALYEFAQQDSSETVADHATQLRVFSTSKPTIRPYYAGMPIRGKTVDPSSNSPKAYCLSQSSTSDTSTPTPSSSAPTTPGDVALSPKTMLSAARTDPFNTLPLELDLEGQRLFDFYVNEMPACSYGNHFRSAKAHNCEAFLRNLEQTVLKCEVNMSGSVEALLQIMLACEDGSIEFPESTRHPGDSPEFTQYSPTAQTPYDRPWFAGRMLKVVKRLSFDSWMNVNYFLFSCLTLHTGIPSVSIWEDSLRKEILSAPLTSYVMPALQGL